MNDPSVADGPACRRLALLRRRRRSRAILVVLLACTALVYAVAMAKMAERTTVVPTAAPASAP